MRVHPFHSPNNNNNKRKPNQPSDKQTCKRVVQTNDQTVWINNIMHRFFTRCSENENPEQMTDENVYGPERVHPFAFHVSISMTIFAKGPSAFEIQLYECKVCFTLNQVLAFCNSERIESSNCRESIKLPTIEDLSTFYSQTICPQLVMLGEIFHNPPDKILYLFSSPTNTI